MAQWYAVLTFLSIVALSESLQELRRCSQLGQYAMPDKISNNVMRKDFLAKVLAHAPPKDVSVSLVYQCALEGVAGLILENPEKPLTCPESLGMYPLIFDEDENKVIDNLADAAIGKWKEHIPHVTYATSFGCNYRNEHGRHRFLCLLK